MRYSYSALNQLAQCEKKYTLRYIELLEADRPDKPAPLRGTAWHAVMQANLLQLGAHRGSLLVQPEKIQILKGFELAIDWTKDTLPTIPGPDYGEEMLLNPQAVIAHLRSWWEHQETDYTEEMAENYGAPLADRLTDLWIRYSLFYKDDLERYVPLVTEYEWSREYGGKLLQGRVDAVLLDTEVNLVVVRDCKTHESWPSEPDAVLDIMDSQLHLQAWGMAPLLKEHGLSPAMVQFDRVRFKKPTEPKLTAKGELSKAISDYDSYTYRNWCNEVGLEEDPAVIEKCDLKTDAWFRRSQKPLSMRAVTAHVKALRKQIQRSEGLDMATAMPVPSKSCAFCEFLSLCRADLIGGRAEEFHPSEFGLRKVK